jgi:GntR family transcriptional regulator / MocR family aminotransferase
VAGVAAGLHLLIRLPNRVAETHAVDRLRDHGIWTTPLSRYQHRPTDAGIVLGFARLAPQHAPSVSQHLAAALQDL